MEANQSFFGKDWSFSTYIILVFIYEECMSIQVCMKHWIMEHVIKCTIMFPAHIFLVLILKVNDSDIFSIHFSQ